MFLPTKIGRRGYKRHMEYIIYCEWYGKKIKTTVDADSISVAKNKVREAVIFHKIIKNDKDPVVDQLKAMLGIKDNL